MERLAQDIFPVGRLQRQASITELFSKKGEPFFRIREPAAPVATLLPSEGTSYGAGGKHGHPSTNLRVMEAWL